MKIATWISIWMLSVNMLHAQDYFFTLTEGWYGKFSYEYGPVYHHFSLGLMNGGGSVDHTYIMSGISPNGESVEISEFWLPGLETTTTYSELCVQFLGPENLLITGSAGNPSTDSVSGRIFVRSIEEDQYEEVFDYAESDTDPSLFLCSHLNEDSILFVGSQVTTGGQTVARILKIDSEFDLVWESEDFDCGSFCRYFPEQILELTNGNVAVLLTDFFFDSPPQETRERTILLMLDPDGNEIWREYPGDDEGHWIRPGAMLEVDGEILVSFTDPYYYDENDMWQGNPQSTVHFESYSLDGELLDSTYYQEFIDLIGGIHRVSQILELDDGSFVIAGYLQYAYAFLFKVDNNLNLTWLRTYEPHPEIENFGDHTHIFSVNPTSDGGFICAGQYESDPTILYPQGIQTAFALKVDEYGCLEPGCQTVGLEELDPSTGTGSSLRVWPNPTAGLLRVDTPLGVRGARWEILDAAGRRVSDFGFVVSGSEEVSFDLSSLPSGLYVIRLVCDEGVYSAKVMKD